MWEDVDFVGMLRDLNRVAREFELSAEEQDQLAQRQWGISRTDLVSAVRSLPKAQAEVLGTKDLLAAGARGITFGALPKTDRAKRLEENYGSELRALDWIGKVAGGVGVGATLAGMGVAARTGVGQAGKLASQGKLFAAAQEVSPSLAQAPFPILRGLKVAATEPLKAGGRLFAKALKSDIAKFGGAAGAGSEIARRLFGAARQTVIEGDVD